MAACIHPAASGTPCIPGDVLAAVVHEGLVPGPGAAVMEVAGVPAIVATLFGRVERNSSSIGVAVAYNTAPSAIVPHVGCIVICRVARVVQAKATVDIVAVDGRAAAASFQAAIRLPDVHVRQKLDSLKMLNCFRAGDIVRARVLSLGDARNVFLSTAEPNLGVIIATNDAGHAMAPESSGDFMVCSVTGARQPRKAAIPSP